MNLVAGEVKTMNEMAVHERINFAELFQVGKNSCRERKRNVSR